MCSSNSMYVLTRLFSFFWHILLFSIKKKTCGYIWEYLEYCPFSESAFRSTDWPWMIFLPGEVSHALLFCNIREWYFISRSAASFPILLQMFEKVGPLTLVQDLGSILVSAFHYNRQAWFAYVCYRFRAIFSLVCHSKWPKMSQSGDLQEPQWHNGAMIIRFSV